MKVFGLQQEVSTQGLQLFWHFETEWVLKNLKVPPLTFSDTVTLFKKSHFFYFSLFSASKVYPIHFFVFHVLQRTEVSKWQSVHQFTNLQTLSFLALKLALTLAVPGFYGL